MPRFERKFKIWEYWVSHSQLLLRSPGDLRCLPGSSDSRNIDIVFVGVDYIELPTLMWEMELLDATSEDCLKAEQVLGGPVSKERVFVVTTKGRRYLIVAASMTSIENDLGLMQSSLERF